MYTKDWLSKWAIYNPDKIAIEEYETERNLTYSYLNTNAIKLVALLRAWNVTKGDRVLVVAEHSLELVTLFGAAQKCGIIIVPVNYRLAPAEIDFLIENCSPALILHDRQFLQKVALLKNARSIHTEILEDLSALIEKIAIKETEPVSLREDDPLFILYTSGTTGFPKGAIYTYKMLFWNSLNTTMSLALTPNDHTINCMPAFHTGGWNVLLTPMLHRGATVGIVKKFDAEHLLNLLDQQQSTVFMGVPTMLKMMMDAPAFDKVKLEKLRYFIVGGEALPHPVIKRWHNKGISIRQGYGLTEVGPNLTSLHQEDAERKLGSIGKPNFYVEAALFDENMQEVRPGEIGEFCLRGEVVTPGYWQNEEATREAISDGWFRTGDLMEKDDEGYLYVVDRKKCMFISGGENVYPAEVERVLISAEGVSEVAVVGVPDDKWGEVGKAYIVIKEGYKTDGIQSFCCDKLAKFKIPKYFVTIDELPKNDSGKIDRKALKTLHYES
ncbi:Long-chain-fatty-acid--CoA ligase [Fulvivirga imtechensis AK7]|uniref:Long-chain-fatty-acid--CoA ligase n=1 Tax=Fulvivirga imtechensis AK7 TaxID=1237149 RepID=L8JSR7_9BACT|nr:o-succinylbenzoate--CoA ligase [Fulvivirga imtechensis]ELR70539.1 Long-chain-fatty-acid--CoA ligase [Fulvivirga imtechensis AK7]